LPYNLFYFRFEEALKVYRLRYPLTGPFYPLQKLTMDEEGDMGHGTQFAINKTSYWETDRYGYRKADSTATPDLVVIGDSNIYGNGLTQSDIFSEVLQRKLQRSVYPYANGYINGFIHNKRFVSTPPKVVILGMVERDILSDNKRLQLNADDLSLKLRIKSKLISLPRIDDKYLTQTAILLDRLLKAELFHYFKAKLVPTTMGVRYHDMFFLQGTKAPVTAKDYEIINTIEIISEYNDYFKKKDILFIYMPIPNKETIYYDLLPSKPEFTILRRVLQGLKQAGVPTIDLLSAFESYKQNGGNPYQIDDTHWNAAGVKIAADLAADKILHVE